MKRRLATLALLLPLLGGCSLFFDEAPGIPVLKLYNNSGRTILVDDDQIKQGKSGTIAFPEKPGTPLLVFSNGCLYTYVFDSRPGELRGVDWLMRLSYRLQLEPDGRIHGLPGGVRVPADVSQVPQPEGFPLEPREGSTCR